jgi:hypothetical protein
MYYFLFQQVSHALRTAAAGDSLLIVIGKYQMSHIYEDAQHTRFGCHPNHAVS